MDNNYIFIISICIIILLLVLLTANDKYKQPKYRLLYEPYIIDMEKMRLRLFYNI